jgi:hypothetical protein
MGRPRSIEKKERPQAAELSQLKEELRRASEKLESREAKLAQALEQQISTTEILRLIASSPIDLQPVLETVIETAAQLCNAKELGSTIPVEIVPLTYQVTGDSSEN